MDGVGTRNRMGRAEEVLDKTGTRDRELRDNSRCLVKKTVPAQDPGRDTAMVSPHTGLLDARKVNQLYTYDHSTALKLASVADCVRLISRKGTSHKHPT